MSGANEVLKTLFSDQTVELPVSGEVVQIKKVTMRTLQPVTDLLARVLEDLQLAGTVPTVDLNSPAVILKLISKYFRDVTSIVASLSTVTEDQFLDMDAADSVVVVQAVALLNKDFFMKTVLPNMRLLAEEEEKAA